MKLKPIAVALIIAGAIAAAYGGVQTYRWRDRAVQASAATTDPLMRIREQHIQRLANEGFATVRAAAAPWLWGGIAAVVVGLFVLRVTAKREPPPADLFQH